MSSGYVCDKGGHGLWMFRGDVWEPVTIYFFIKGKKGN